MPICIKITHTVCKGTPCLGCNCQFSKVIFCYLAFETFKKKVKKANCRAGYQHFVSENGRHSLNFAVSSLFCSRNLSMKLFLSLKPAHSIMYIFRKNIYIVLFKFPLNSENYGMFFRVFRIHL